MTIVIIEAVMGRGSQARRAGRKKLPRTYTRDAVKHRQQQGDYPLYGYVVQLPAEANPFDDRPDHPPIPVYIGWKGRALHLQLAVLFQEREQAERAAQAFERFEVKQCNFERDLSALTDVSWLAVAVPDPDQQATLPFDEADILCSDDLDEEQSAELDRHKAKLTVTDSRAPGSPECRLMVIDLLLGSPAANHHFV